MCVCSFRLERKKLLKVNEKHDDIACARGRLHGYNKDTFAVMKFGAASNDILYFSSHNRRAENRKQRPLSQIEQLTHLFCDFFVSLICFLFLFFATLRCEPKDARKFLFFSWLRHLSLRLSRELMSKVIIIYFESK